MKKKWIIIGIVVLIIAIQLWPVERTNPPVSAELQAPPDVKAVLRTACYNCHSNETHWPWYGYVAPVSWMIADDVMEARDDMNFSEWDSIPAGDRPAMVKHIWKMVNEGKMPLPMYRLMHPEARLTEDQKKILQDWSLSNSF
jgi:hypothetical protein